MTFIQLLLIAFAGLFAHWLKRWGRGQTTVGFIEYMRQYHRHSIASVCSVVASVISLYSVDGFAANDTTPAIAFLLGFTLDSTLNKSPKRAS